MHLPFYGVNTQFPFAIPSTVGNIQAFNNTNGGWDEWRKPDGMTMFWAMAIGGGGGGGGGFTAVSGSAKGGGGGGACSGIATVLAPLFMVPKILKIQVGAGGAGGTAGGGNGGVGNHSYVAVGNGIIAGNAAPNMILESNNGTSNIGGGSGGGGAGNANGGAVPTIATKARITWFGAYSFQQFTVGITGATGGSPTSAGTGVSNVWNTLATCPGTGGGGVTTAGTGFAGGSMTVINSLDFGEGSLKFDAANFTGGTAGSGVLAGGNGSNGVQYYSPFLMSGGLGGGSAAGQIGGNGGAGGIGCGGGGGGAGTTGGIGGRGGDGIVVIICW